LLKAYLVYHFLSIPVLAVGPMPHAECITRGTEFLDLMHSVAPDREFSFTCPSQLPAQAPVPPVRPHANP
jgi:hypothetical protein